MRQSPTGKGPYVYGNNSKVCNCEIHNGALVPAERFSIIQTGPRKGLLRSRCRMSEKLRRGFDPNESGLVPIHEVKFIFEELSYRIGKTETCRQLGISHNFWMRMRRNKSMRKLVVRRAMALLLELRKENVARHKNSIRHGAAARGHKEKIPIRSADFNGPNNCLAIYKRNYLAKNAEQAAITRERDRNRKKRAHAISK